MVTDDKRKALYDAVGKEYNLGTYDEFTQKLEDPIKRKALYDAVGKQYSLGTFEEFETKVQPDVKKKSEPVVSASPSPDGTLQSPASSSNPMGDMANASVEVALPQGQGGSSPKENLLKEKPVTPAGLPQQPTPQPQSTSVWDNLKQTMGFIQDQSAQYAEGALKNVNVGLTGVAKHLDTASKAIHDATGLDYGGGFGLLHDWMKSNTVDNLRDVPEGIAGDVIKQAGQLSGLTLEMAMAPEMSILKLPMVLGTSGALDKYSEVSDKNIPFKEKAKEVAGAFQTGASAGSVFAVMGVGGGVLKNAITTKTGSDILGYIANLATNSGGFAGYTALEGGDKKQIISSALLGGVMTVPEVAHLVWGSSVSRAINTSPESIKTINNANIDPEKVLGKIQDIDKQIANQSKPVDQFKLNEDIFAAQKRLGLPNEPEVPITPGTLDILGKLQKGEPVTNDLLSQASTELYEIRKGLEGVSKTTTRKFTTDQIFQKTNALGNLIETLENAKQTQVENDAFLDPQNQNVVSSVVNDNLASLIAQKTVLQNTLVTNAGIQSIKENPAAVLDAIKQSDMSPEEKKSATDKVSDIVNQTDPVFQKEKPIIDEIQNVKAQEQSELDAINLLNQPPETKQRRTNEVTAKYTDKVNELNQQLSDVQKPQVDTPTGTPTPKSTEVAPERVEPISQLGTGANVYYETPKLRVNETKNGKVLLNIYDNSDGLTPMANIKFDTPVEAVKIAERINKEYPNGVPPALLIEKVVDGWRKEQVQPEVPGRETGQNVIPSAPDPPTAGEGTGEVNMQIIKASKIVEEALGVSGEEANVLTMLQESKLLSPTEKQMLYRQYKRGVMNQEEISKYTNIDMADFDAKKLSKWTKVILDKNKGKKIDAETIDFEELPPSEGKVSEQVKPSNITPNGKETAQKGKGLLSKSKQNKTAGEATAEPAVPPEGLTQAEFPRWAADNATDPNDVLIAHEQELSNNSAAKLEGWQQDLLKWRFDEESFNKFGDKNNTTFEPWKFKKAWFQPKSKGGLQGGKRIGIDDFIVDQEGKGRNVTESEVTEFITDHPNGHVRSTTDLQTELARKYKELTGKSIDQGYRERDANNEQLTTQEHNTASELPQHLVEIIKDQGLDINNIEQFGDNSFIFDPGEYEKVKQYLENQKSDTGTDIRNEVSESVETPSEPVVGETAPGPLERERQDRIAAIDKELPGLEKQRQEAADKANKANELANANRELPLEVPNNGELIGAEKSPLKDSTAELDKKIKDLQAERSTLVSKEQQVKEADQAQGSLPLAETPKTVEQLQTELAQGKWAGRMNEYGKAMEDARKNEPPSRPGDFIRNLKFNKGPSDTMQSNVLGVPMAVWDGIMESIASAIDAGATIGKAVSQGIDELKKSKWYKDLTYAEKKDKEKLLEDHIRTEARNIGFDDSEITLDRVKEVMDEAKANKIKKTFVQKLRENHILIKAATEVRDAFHPFFQDYARKTVTILREKLGEMYRRNVLADEGSKKSILFWDRKSPEEKVWFMTNLERGKDFENPKIKALVDAYRSRLDNIYNLIKDVKDIPYIEDYFPHFWKDERKARKFYSEHFSKTPMEGSKYFLKQRFYKDIISGIKAGLELKTDNPEEIMRLAEINAFKFRMANDLFSSLKDEGMLKFAQTPKDAPDGWVKIDDPLFNAQKISDRLAGGGYYVPEGAATIIKRYTSRGLMGGSVARSVKGFNNLLNQFQLGLSLFHGTTTTLDATFTGWALGLDKLSRGKLLSGGADLASSLTVVPNLIHTYIRGIRGKNDFENGKLTPDVEKMITANSRTGMDPIYKTNAWFNFRRSLAKGGWNYAKVPFQIPLAIVDAVSKPIFEYHVPILKIGSALRIAENELSKLNNPTKEETAHVIQKAWDSMDDRLGQMTYDNLFWGKTTKDIGFLSVRSLGWNLGTVRAFGKGVGGVPESAKSLVKGKGINPNTAWLMSLVIGTATYGAMYQYMMTGKKPDDWKDYFYPRDGTLNPDGTEHRINFPTYMKEVFNTYERGTLKHARAKLSPIANIVAETLSNEDFYGNQIYSEDDPVYRNGLDVLKYTAEQFTPFTFRKQPGEDAGKSFGQSMQEQFTGKALERKFGLTDAPKNVQREDWQNTIVKESMKTMDERARTKQEAITYKVRRDLREMIYHDPLKNGEKISDKPWNKEMSKAVNDGIISRGDVKTFVNKSTMNPYHSMFKNMSTEQQFNVLQQLWQSGDKKHWTELAPFINTSQKSWEMFMLKRQAKGK